LDTKTKKMGLDRPNGDSGFSHFRPIFGVFEAIFKKGFGSLSRKNYFYVGFNFNLIHQMLRIYMARIFTGII